MQRCYRPACHDFARYGGSGVAVCARWHLFEAFLADMGERPAGRTLDRKDRSLGYTPENCRWATAVEQSRNRSIVRELEFAGLRMTIPEWAEVTGIPYRRLRARFERGWSPEMALGDYTPVED